MDKHSATATSPKPQLITKIPYLITIFRRCGGRHMTLPPSAALAQPPPCTPASMTNEKLQTCSTDMTIVPETMSSASSTPSMSLISSSSKQLPMKSIRFFRLFRSVLRSFPILTPKLKFPAISRKQSASQIHGETRMTGTFFGRRKARISLAIQENPRCTPLVLLELAMPTSKLLQDMAPGHVRISLECEKRTAGVTKLMDEPVWTMYCDGRKTGYSKRREPTDEDRNIMELLHAVSMGIGVIPSDKEELSDGELTYMRANLERVVGSSDSETYYLAFPDQNSNLELSIFFLRI